MVLVSLLRLISFETILIVIRPVSTYSRRGALKQGLNVMDHAIIHMRGERPVVLPGERERGMYKEPIEVVPAPAQRLSETSRINFGTIHTVQYYSPVCAVGMVSDGSKAKLEQYWRNTRDATPRETTPIAVPPYTSSFPTPTYPTPHY